MRPDMLKIFLHLLVFLLIDISHGAISTTISTSGSSNAGKSYTLTCTITTSTTPTVTWSKGGSNLATDADLGITVGGVSGGSGSYTSVLTLNPLKVAHGGVYTCSADAGADSESDDETVNVQIPDPVSGPFIIRDENSFSGTELEFSCLFGFDSTADMDTGIEKVASWFKDGVLMTGNARITVTPPSKGAGTNTYRGTLHFKYLIQSDTGKYSCSVYISSTTNGQFVSNSTTSTVNTLSVKAPIPDVTLTSTVYRIPSHPDYNTLILTCSDTLPIADNDELAFDKQYTWTHDGANVSYSVTGPSNLKAKQSVSRLEASLTTPGEVVFKCIVSISIPGDPVVSRNKSVAITVLDAATPQPPTNPYVTNITIHSAIISWTISRLAYTPEQYVVLYGTSQSSLTSTSAIVNSTTNYGSQDVKYSIKLTDLSSNTFFFYQVRSNNTEGTTYSNFGNFTTMNVEAPNGAPRDFEATPSSPTTVSFQWRNVEEPLRNDNITVYSLTCNSSQPTKTIPAQQALESSTDNEAKYSVDISGLLPYMVYSCTIYANNSGGAGPSALTQVRTLEDKPSVPSNVVISVESSSSVIVNWSPPETPNGVITQYTIYIDLLNGTTQFENIDSTLTTYRIVGLRPYQLLEVRVSASTRVGEGPQTSTVEGRSGESIPGTLIGVAYHILSSSRVKVNFTSQSTSITNGVVLHYRISLSSYMGAEISAKRILGNESTIETEFNNLRGEVPYVVTVSAVNSAGEGENTTMIFFTREGVPPPPTITNAIRINGTHMNISWTPIPLIESKGFIRSYTISYTIASRKRQSGTRIVPGNQTYVVISGLSPSDRYTVTVRASTKAGIGFGSSPMTVSAPPDTGSGTFFTLVNVLIMAVVVAVILIVLVLIVLAAVVCSVKRKNRNSDLPVELGGHKVVPSEKIVFDMAQSPAYGQLVSTPEPDKDLGDPLHFSAQNPTYGKPYEHTYESIDNIIASRGGIQAYDYPKPQLPAPRSTSSNGSSPTEFT